VGQQQPNSAAVLASISPTEIKRAPLKLHGQGTTEEGTLTFSPEFIRFVGYLECAQPDCAECRTERARNKNAQGWRNPEARLRATRAFRKLRRIAPREFDALYLYCITRNTVPEIAKALTERAIRLGHPERYDNAGVFLLMLSGIDKVIKHW
jgi:hypothetical protein